MTTDDEVADMTTSTTPPAQDASMTTSTTPPAQPVKPVKPVKPAAPVTANGPTQIHIETPRALKSTEVSTVVEALSRITVTG